MSGFEGKFGRKQEAAILALLSAKNVEEPARVAGVTPRTLYRWQNEPEFDAAYRAAKRAAFRQAIARLHHLTSAAVSTLGKVMLDAATPPATKVRAADSILDHTIKAIETEDILARLSALEAAARNLDPANRADSSRTRMLAQGATLEEAFANRTPAEAAAIDSFNAETEVAALTINGRPLSQAEVKSIDLQLRDSQ